MDGLKEKKWFVYISDHHEGPYSIEDLQSKQEEGIITQDSYVWAEGMPDWKNITDVADFSAMIKGLSISIAPEGHAKAPESKPDLPLDPQDSEPTLDVSEAPALENNSVPHLMDEPAASIAAVSPESSNPLSDEPTDPDLSRNREPSPSIIDEKTGEFNPPEMQVASDPTPELGLGPSPAVDPVSDPVLAPAPEPDPIPVSNTPDEPDPIRQRILAEKKLEKEKAEKSKAKAKPKTEKSKLGLKLLTGALVLGGIGAASLFGLFDSTIHSPAVQVAFQSLHEAAQPYLFELVQRVPSLGQWISPIPHLEDVNAAEYTELKNAALEDLKKSGPHAAIAMSKADPYSPFFYLASNLPEGTRFQIYVLGIPDTLLNHLAFGAQTEAVIEKKLGKSGVIRFSDGKPVPKGEYEVYVTISENQSPEVKALIGSFQPFTDKIPNEIPDQVKVIRKQNYFLGGTRDTTYASRLKEFHDKLRAKAEGELAEIKQFQVTLESQFNSTSTKFKLLRGKKITPRQRKAWETFHSEWIKLQTSLDQIFSNWTPEVQKNDFFYGPLYQMVQQTGQSILRVHGFQHSFFVGSHDAKTFDIQIGEALSTAQNSLHLLQAKIESTQKLTPTPNGMPRREGL